MEGDSIPGQDSESPFQPPSQPNSDYFKSYEDLNVHLLMLNDMPRVSAYRNAILSQTKLFKDKVVIDVGSGTGLLSIFCAQAGARRVWAIEASDVASLSEKIIEENGLQDIIKVINLPVESVELSERADIIVSEWMGFFLLHESMLPSVLVARDKFLKPDGLIFPKKCTLYTAMFSDPDLSDRWDDFQGIKMKSFAEALQAQRSGLEIKVIPPESLVSNISKVVELDLNSTSIYQEFQNVSESTFKKECVVHGIAMWFEVEFPGGAILSTSPFDVPTHWKQSLIYLPPAPVTEGLKMAFTITFSNTGRTYQVQIEGVDEEDQETEHPIPCECDMIACVIKRAYLNKLQSNVSDE